MGDFLARVDGFHPALGEGVVGDEAFDGADGDAFEAFLDNAIAFAEAVLRADAAADFGEVIGGGGDFVGFFQAAFGGELQPVRDVVVQRAVHRAERHAALAAAAGLGGGFLGREIAVDFVEIGAAVGDAAFGRLVLRQVSETQHFLGHRRNSGIVAPPCYARK